MISITLWTAICGYMVLTIAWAFLHAYLFDLKAARPPKWVGWDGGFWNAYRCAGLLILAGVMLWFSALFHENGMTAEGEVLWLLIQAGAVGAWVLTRTARFIVRLCTYKALHTHDPSKDGPQPVEIKKLW